jgi:glycosyltransferase involved in cell wall biosynthesis
VHSILKFQALRKEFKADVVLAISPRDAKYYRKIGFGLFSKKIKIMPLRQMINHNFEDDSSYTGNRLNIGFLGSTYNVLHNKKSLEFVLNEIPHVCWERDTIQLNIYGRKIPRLLQSREIKNVIFHNWVEDINEIYQKNNCFIVPFFLASGMQSKVFEPLIRGRVLICDPRVLSDYPFQPFQHYIPAKTGKDFADAITWLLANPNEANKISKNARTFAQQILGKQHILDQTAKLIAGL